MLLSLSLLHLTTTFCLPAYLSTFVYFRLPASRSVTKYESPITLPSPVTSHDTRLQRRLVSYAGNYCPCIIFGWGRAISERHYNIFSSPFKHLLTPCKTRPFREGWLFGWLMFICTFSTNRPYRAYEIYILCRARGKHTVT